MPFALATRSTARRDHTDPLTWYCYAPIVVNTRHIALVTLLYGVLMKILATVFVVGALFGCSKDPSVGNGPGEADGAGGRADPPAATAPQEEAASQSTDANDGSATSER